jgi:hypothetical protein
MTSSDDFSAIAEKLKQLKGFRTDSELAAALGLGRTAFSNRKQAGSIPYAAICELCLRAGLSLDLVFGLDTGRWTARDGQEGELLEAFRQLDEEDRRAVVRHAASLVPHRQP